MKALLAFVAGSSIVAGACVSDESELESPVEEILGGKEDSYECRQGQRPAATLGERPGDRPKRYCVDADAPIVSEVQFATSGSLQVAMDTRELSYESRVGERCTVNCYLIRTEFVKSSKLFHIDLIDIISRPSAQSSGWADRIQFSAHVPSVAGPGSYDGFGKLRLGATGDGNVANFDGLEYAPEDPLRRPNCRFHLGLEEPGKGSFTCTFRAPTRNNGPNAMPRVTGPMTIRGTFEANDVALGSGAQLVFATP